MKPFWELWQAWTVQSYDWFILRNNSEAVIWLVYFTERLGSSDMIGLFYWTTREQWYDWFILRNDSGAVIWLVYFTEQLGSSHMIGLFYRKTREQWYDWFILQNDLKAVIWLVYFTEWLESSDRIGLFYRTTREQSYTRERQSVTQPDGSVTSIERRVYRNPSGENSSNASMVCREDQWFSG